MSKATTNEPTVAQIVHARGLQTLDVDTSHKIVGAVAATLRRMGHEATADALILSVSKLWNASAIAQAPFTKLPEGCTPVSSEQWGRIGGLVPAHVYEESELPTDEIAADWLTIAVEDAIRYDRARAYLSVASGIVNPDEEGFRMVYERLVRERDDERRQKQIGMEAWREMRAVLSPECESDQAAIVLAQAVVAERDRLKDELSQAGESASAALQQIASLKDALGSAHAQRDRYLSEIESRNEEIARLSARRNEGALGQPKSEPATSREQPEPEKAECRPVDDAPAVLYENPPVPESFPGRDNPEPVRVTFADPKPKVPTLEDRIEAIRRLALGEAKADIAISLGLRNAAQVHGMTMMDKKHIDRVRQAAPHEKEGELAKVRKEIEAAKGAANG